MQGRIRRRAGAGVVATGEGSDWRSLSWGLGVIGFTESISLTCLWLILTTLFIVLPLKDSKCTVFGGKGYQSGVLQHFVDGLWQGEAASDGLGETIF